MKYPHLSASLKALSLCCLLCAAAVQCFSLDREAFSIRNYDLKLEIDPEQHRLGVRGKVTLRNDTDNAQKIAVLQISSSLGWRSIKAGDRAVQFVTQPFTSDIDHTGQLSEAIVTLPQEVAPHATTDLDIAYEGVILLDATRLTRIGSPEDVAKSNDWDRIDAHFTAVRGAGYVAWYPIATEVANLSEGNSLFQVLGRWKTREAGSVAHLKISASMSGMGPPLRILVDEPSCVYTYEQVSRAQGVEADCRFRIAARTVPSFVLAEYGEVNRPPLLVYNLSPHAAAAEMYADAGQKLLPLITDWFGAPRDKVQIADLASDNAAPFESGALLLAPLASSDPVRAGLSVAHQLTHAAFSSSRPWIEEGLAHFSQALYLEQEKGRPAAISYMKAHGSALGKAEVSSTPRSEDAIDNSLANTVNEELYRSKAMFVWWMLRDIVGDAALKKALAGYKPEQDKDPSYMPRLISAQTPRDLEWFFDDWVYRDRGLPDFKVESASSRKTLTNSFMTAVTVENLGAAGAEVPVRVKFAGGEVAKRLEVRGKQKATIRIETPSPAQEVVVNDGSVPENRTDNNTFKVDPPQR